MAKARTSGRRRFLKTLPAAIGAGIVARSVAPSAQAPGGQAPAAVPITAETLGVAQQVAGVALPVEEREAARTLVARNLTNIDAIRKVGLTADIEPAFSYRPSVGSSGSSGSSGSAGSLGRALQRQTIG